MFAVVALLAPAYRPRRPTETVLYTLVRQNLESFLAHARENYDGGLPRYVEQEFRAYLKCGQFSEGFSRCRCEACGHDLLVAFSCHKRSLCPSCAGRRMANVAAHLVDRVLPDVPLRQYVLTLPYELRKLVAFKADVLTAIARAFVAAGARVLIAGRRRETLEAAAADLGGEARAVPADVSRPEDCERIVSAAYDAWGRADALVNNAAHFAVQPLLEARQDDAELFFGANLCGPLYCSQAFARRIIDREAAGAIVNISSIAGARPAQSCGLYSATKAALDSLTRTMAVEWTRRGVRVNAVAPGHVETEGVIEDFNAGRLDRAAMMDRIPAGRIAALDDIADAALFLASERARHIVGQVLTVDGGEAL